MSAITPANNLLTADLDHILQHTQLLWESVRGRRIFVTGGTGFIGRWLLESFAHANRKLKLAASMSVLSRDPDAFMRKAPHLSPQAGIEFVQGDVRSFAARDGERFDFVIHAATEASAKLNEENPLLMVDTIVQGTRAALEFACATGAKRFLLTSSGAVYGQQPSTMTHVTEEYLGGPDCARSTSAYGEGKRLAELLCACYQQQPGLEPLIARCFAFVGPFLPLDAHFAIGNFIRDALAGGPIRVGGDGTPYRSYLYAADLAIWLWTILFRGKPMHPYNVGSADALTIVQLAETVRNSIQESLSVVVAKKITPGAAPTRYVPATSRAQAELGLRETVALTDAIMRTARYASIGVQA